MPRPRFFHTLACLAILIAPLPLASLRAEIPLPDAIVHGVLAIDGVVVTTGTLTGLVERDEVTVLEVRGEFIEGEYILRIPMETDIGAPGPSGQAAHVGDVLAAIALDGTIVASPRATLEFAKLERYAIGVGGLVSFRRGDCNGDQNVDIADAIFSLLYQFRGGGAPGCEKACDSNDDGQLDLADAVFVLDFLFSRSEAMPAPRACGIDFTADTLSCVSGPCEDLLGEAAGMLVEAGDDAGDRERDFLVASLPTDASRARSGAPSTLAVSLAAAGRDRSRLPRSKEHGVWTSELEVSPATINMGHVGPGTLAPGGASTQSLTIVSRAEAEIALEARSDSSRFVASPSTLRVPPGAAFAVFVRSVSSTEPRRALVDDIGEAASLELFSGGELVARVPIEYSAREGEVDIEIADVTVQASSAPTFAVPITVRGNGELRGLAVTLELDADRFEAVGLVGDAPWRLAPLATRGSFLVTFDTEDGTHEASASLVLSARAALEPGTCPVLVSSAEAVARDGRPVAVSSRSGEVRCQGAWLDIDGDGVTLPGLELALAARYFGGTRPTWPAEWSAVPMEVEELERTLESCAAFLDVDGSGDVERSDLKSVTAALCGLPVSGRDRMARIDNIRLRDAARPVELERLGLSGDALERGVVPGAVLRLPLLLDLVEALPSLRGKLLLSDAASIVERVELEAGARLEGSTVALNGVGGEYELRIDPGAASSAAVREGLEPIGEIVLEISRLASPGELEVELSTASDVPPAWSGKLAILEPLGAAIVVRACAYNPDTDRVAIELGQRGVADANLVHMTLAYSPTQLAFRRACAAFEEIEIAAADRPDEGRLDVVAYHPEGMPLRGELGPAALVTLFLEATDSEPSGEIALSAVDAQSGAARKRVLLGAYGHVDDIAGADCELIECAWRRQRLDLDGAARVVRHIFLGARPPDCPEARDLDCDGRLELDDAVLAIRRNFGL